MTALALYIGALVVGLLAAACAAGCLAAMRQSRSDRTAERLLQGVLDGLAAAARERRVDEEGHSFRVQYWKIRLRYAWAKLHLPLSAALFLAAAGAAVMAGLRSGVDAEQSLRWLLAALGIEMAVVAWWVLTLRGGRTGRRDG